MTMKQEVDSVPRIISGRMTPKMKRLTTIMQDATAILSDTNLKTLIMLIMMQIEIMSEIIQFLEENHHPKVKLKPIVRLKMSTRRILSFLSRYYFLRKVCLKNRKRISRATIPTDTGLTIQLTTSRKIAAALGAQIVIIPTPNIIADINRIHLKLYYIPDPLKDSSLAKIVAKISTTVAHAEMINCPHSNTAGQNYRLQSNQQEKVPISCIDSWTISKQFSSSSWRGQL